MRRTDTAGRDVTGLPGLWSDEDTVSMPAKEYERLPVCETCISRLEWCEIWDIIRAAHIDYSERSLPEKVCFMVELINKQDETT